MANWYKFESQDLFDVWHEIVKADLGIPYPNKNLETGEIDEDAQWTTSFIEPYIVSETDLRIYLTDEYSDTYSQELGEVSEAPYNESLDLKL
jgi:hypothetical protein